MQKEHKEELIKMAHDFVFSIKKGEKAAIMHHTDPDGVCSGVLAARAVEAARGKPADVIFCQRDGDTSVTWETVKQLRQKKIEKLITVDLAVDETPGTIRALERFCKILIVDHHLKTNELGSENIMFVKAEDISGVPPARYPASKMVYDIFSSTLKNYAWVAGIGVIGDYADEEWRAFLLDVEKNGTPMADLRAAEELISYARAANHEAGVKEAFDIVLGAKNVKDILKSRLVKYKDAIEEELSRHVQEHKKTAVFAGDMVLYEIKQKHNVKSRLSNILSHKLYPDKTVIVIQAGSKRADVSARRQDGKKSMAELLKKAVAGIPDSLGGGHVPAAGGYFPKEYLAEVKKRLIAEASQS